MKVKGLLFKPKINFKQGVPVNKKLIRTQRDANEARKLLNEAKRRGIRLTISGHLRGIDGPGSSLDLPEFQKRLTKVGINLLKDYPSTPTIASNFTVKIIFDIAEDEDVVEYIAPDYGINEDNPYCIKGGVKLDRYGRTTQKDAPAFIFQNLFGLSGVRVICESISPMALAGGMESSNAFNVALIAAASMLSGADLDFAEIFNLAVKLENDEFGGSTGGQGHLSFILGGGYHHIWLSGIKSRFFKRLINPYSVFSIPLLKIDELKQIEDHVLFVQAGKDYRDGKPLISRVASVSNNMWTDLLHDEDEVAMPLFNEMLLLTAEYTSALRGKNFKIAVDTIMRYVKIRDDLCRRWLNDYF